MDASRSIERLSTATAFVSYQLVTQVPNVRKHVQTLGNSLIYRHDFTEFLTKVVSF
jgi:hypothetical protein